MRKRLLFLGALLTLIAVFAVFALPKLVRGIQYPVRYEPEIRAAAAEFGLNPALVAAIAYTESGYRADARSSVGAMGLMQIMSDTGKWIAGKLGEADSFSDGSLFSPQTALRYGCWYLRFLLMEFGGDETCAVAAYHAGQGSVRKWLSDPAYSDDGLTVRAFPDDAPQTRHYIAKVRKAYEYYQNAYR